ncbi:hypothetical protein EYZ11_011909 [Aspergillus tanneri]|uniref:FMN-dependent dehydrogenase domain-containing protein n=1 Tax=Aspergillus tanneri TaxID=1220188 RepID=A0A4S3J259_9EURO|nr:hypothetical protein EYZ11_011909 [Aspergillus tanneri]
MANRPPTLDKRVFCIKDLKDAGNQKLPRVYRAFERMKQPLTTTKFDLGFWSMSMRLILQLASLDVAFPLAFSPTGMQKLAHPDGELATSRAAASSGLSMVLSSYSTVSLEEVIAHGQENPYAIQMCILRDRSIALQLLKRAENFPIIGQRLNEYRNGFVLPEHMSYPNLNFGGKHSFFDEDGRKSYGKPIRKSSAVRTK